MVRRPEIGQEVVIWKRGWLAPSYTVRRDPLSIGISFLVNIGWTGAISGIGATIVGSVILGAAALGVSLLSNAVFSQRAQERTPSERQATLRQSLGARVRFYGRVKVGGTLSFFESKNGILYSEVTANEGLISQVVEYWLNDLRVYLDSGGLVITAPYAALGVARILVKDGSPNQTVHARLDADFPEITPDHRLRGTANFLTIFREVPADKIAEVYPQLNPQCRLVIDSSIIKSVRTGEMVYSDNLADAIYDYLTGVDGAGFAYGAGYSESQVNLASFQRYADICDTPQPLKAGGSIRQFRIAGGYAMNEEMRTTLPRMLSAGDGSLYMDTDGKIAIRGGAWVPPVLTLDARQGHIISAQFRHGQGSLAAFNELTLTYTEPTLDYQEVEAERWLDASNIAMRGRVLPSQLDLLMVPHHAQARRIGKIHTNRSNPEWIGTITTNFFGFNAIGEENITVIFPILGINRSFSVQSIKILDDMTGVEISVTSLSASAYAWDPLLEEGAAPGDPPDTSSPVDLPPPDDINVSCVSRDGIPFLVVTWTEPDRTALAQEVEYRTSPGGTWVNMSVSDGVGLAESGVVTSGATYGVRVRTRSPGGQFGEYSPEITIVATPNATAPSAPTLVSANVIGNSVEISITMSPSSNSIGARIYRNTADNFGTSTLIQSIFGSPSTNATYTDTGRPAGTYYYWITAVNGSNFVASTPVATGARVIV